MSWQQNAVLQRTFEGRDHQGEEASDPPGATTTDSSILCYIKTLTNHQTNAKQQRMDRYLQQVKSTQPAEGFSARSSNPPGYHITQRQGLPKAVKAPTMQLLNKDAPREKHKRPGSYSIAQSVHSNRKKVAGSTKDSRLRSKRPHKGSQGNRQPKKPKLAPSKHQVTAIGSLDRFRLHGSWSQEKSQTSASEENAGNKTPQHAAAPTENKTAQQVQLGGSTRMPPTANLGFSTISADLEPWGGEVTSSVQALKPNPLKALTARTVPAPTQDPCNNLIQHTSFLSLEEAQPGNRDCALPQQEVFAPAYDPLSVIMESIYF